MAQPPTLSGSLFTSEEHPSASPLSLDMWVLLGLVGYVDPPDALSPISVAAPAACRKGMGEIPSDAWYTDESSQGNQLMWTAVTVQPNTDTIWMETGMNHSSQWAELRALWLVITHEPRLLTLCIDSCDVLKGLIL